MSVRRPYHGIHPKLVLAFDIGITYSGVSYCVLYPDKIPQINGVMRYVCGVTRNRYADQYIDILARIPAEAIPGYHRSCITTGKESFALSAPKHYKNRSSNKQI